MLEIWKDIKDYEGYYQVSNLGNVRSLDRIVLNRKMKGRKIKDKKDSGNKYHLIILSKDNKQKTCLLHRITLMTFEPNNNPIFEVNHKDGNPSNNKLSNLEWMTRRQNIQHSFDVNMRKPTILKRDNVHLTKLKEADIPEFVRLKKAKVTNKEIAKVFKMSESGIEKVVAKFKNLIYE